MYTTTPVPSHSIPSRNTLLHTLIYPWCYTHRQNTQSYIVQYTTPFPLHPVPAPGVTVPRVTSSLVECETTAHGSATRVIAGYEVTRFGVPMIGQYVNTGRGGELQSALQYQVLSTGLQHGHLVMAGGVQHQQWWMLPLEKQVSHA